MGKAWIYKPRQPQKTAPYRIFSQYYKTFRDIYDEKYLSVYGPFRPIIDETTDRYMKCGILKHGFARVRCSDCGDEYLLPFSCKSRLCPSCMTKTMLQFQEYIQENIIQKVPHRHMVFCLPKILRRGFIRNRGYLNELSRITWKTTMEYMQKTLKKKGIPGGIQIIQTHGNLIGMNPHIHLLVSDGIFTENKTFYCMPSYSEKARKYLQILFEKHVCDFALKKKLVSEQNIKRILSQAHTGFSVYMNTRINCTKYHPEEQATEQDALSAALPGMAEDAAKSWPKS